MSRQSPGKISAQQDAGGTPLCVDMDGTLLRIDTLVESVFALLKKNVFNVFLLPFWLLGGKAYFKQKVADRVDLDAAHLPRNGEFVSYLRERHKRGDALILTSAANAKVANAVAASFGIFDRVLASDGKTNLAGRRKLERLIQEFGEGGFDYAGNARVDVTIWEHAAHALAVNAEQGARRLARRRGIKIKEFDDHGGIGWRVYLRALRIHQWLKNLLIFVPLVMAHKFGDPQLLMQASLAFIAFGLCASSVYVLNDLLDMPEDRQHPTKRRRPFASGELPAVRGFILIPLLLAGAVAVSLPLPWEFAIVLAGYYLVTLAYSVRLKQAALVDVLTLAGLYTLRIIAGAAAVSVTPSFWLLAFSMFLFLSLALVKRFTELMVLQASGREDVAGRGYSSADLEILSQFGTASAYMAVLVLALYINSETVAAMYSRPEVIWLLCPLLLYMVTRVWLLARRDELHEDPVVFVIKDRRSQVMALIGALLLWIAI